MKFLLCLLLTPYYRFKERMTPGEFIRMRGFLDEITPASAEFFRTHPDTVQLFHRIMSHRLRSPTDYAGLPVLTTFLRDLHDITQVPNASTEVATLTAALRVLDDRYSTVNSVLADAISTYTGTELEADREERANASS